MDKQNKQAYLNLILDTIIDVLKHNDIDATLRDN